MKFSSFIEKSLGYTSWKFQVPRSKTGEVIQKIKMGYFLFVHPVYNDVYITDIIYMYIQSVT